MDRVPAECGTAMDRLSVVVVDDDADTRMLLTAALERHGPFEVASACADGVAAVDEVTARQPDVVILDINMPRMGGLEALPRILDASPATRVVVVSGEPPNEVAPAVLRSGAVGFLEKGLSFKTLVHEITALVGILDAVVDAADRVRARYNRDLRAVRDARHIAADALKNWDLTDLVDAVQLAVSELVTNAIIHAQSDPELAITLTPDAVRIEVTDRDSALPRPRMVAADATSGRGLAMVASLAREWGVTRRPEGKTVWVEVDRKQLAGTS